MRNSTEDISTYVFQPADELLLDTNVWFSIYGIREPGDRRATIYSRALGRILAAGCRIYIDALIVSEFINRYARVKYGLIDPGVPFKVFRGGPMFKLIAQGIAVDAKKVMKHCTQLESDFETLDVEALLDEYADGDEDFNDLVLAELCKSRGLKLVTDDGDFRDKGLSIVTGNARLLA
jgi:predicted nucleic acid-binding protein